MDPEPSTQPPTRANPLDVRALCVVRAATPAGVGLVTAALLIFALTTIAGLTLSRSRLAAVVQEGYAAGTLPNSQTGLGEDYFAECADLLMNYARLDGVLLNDVETRIPVWAPAYQHPCGLLQAVTEPEGTPCRLLVGEPKPVCSATVSWDAAAAPSARVAMQDGASADESPLGEGGLGTRRVPVEWGHRYAFRLYEGGSTTPSSTVDLAVPAAAVQSGGPISVSPSTESGPVQIIPYFNYWFGSRYVEAIALSVLSYHQAQVLYTMLGYGSILLLLLAAWTASRTRALLILPIVLMLLFGFGLQFLEHNLATAPAHFFGIAALVFLVAFPRLFQRRANRIGFFVFLGVMVSFFDFAQAIPIILGLAVVLDHVFYVMPKESHRVSAARYWKESIVDAVAIFFCFLSSYTLLSVAHLLILSALHVPGTWQTFIAELQYRVGGQVSATQPATGPGVIEGLWWARFLLAMGGYVPSTLLIYASWAAWAFALLSLPLILYRRSDETDFLLADLGVLIVTTGGCLVWWLGPRNATFLVPMEEIRLAAVPMSLGFLAVVLILAYLARNKSRFTIPYLGVALFLALAISGAMVLRISTVHAPPDRPSGLLGRESIPRPISGSLPGRPEGRAIRSPQGGNRAEPSA
jgi:hypothetical protein